MWQDIAPFLAKPKEVLRGVAADADAFMERLTQKALSGQHEVEVAAEDELVAKLRPVLEPRLAALGTRWEEEAAPALAQLVARGEVLASGPQLDAADATEIETKLLLLLLRPHLSRTLGVSGRGLEGVLTALSAECKVGQLAAALADTESFIEEATAQETTLARYLLRLRLSLQLGPLDRILSSSRYEEHSSELEYHVSTMDADGLREAAADPIGFVHRILPPTLEQPLVARMQSALRPRLPQLQWGRDISLTLRNLVDAGEVDEATDLPELERQLLLALLRPQLSRALTLAGEALEDVLAVLATHCSPRQLSDAVLDTETFLDRATAGDTVVAVSLLSHQLRPILRLLARSEPQVSRVERSLALVSDATQLREIVAQPLEFVLRAVRGVGELPSAMRVRSELEPRLELLGLGGLDWAGTVAPALATVAEEQSTLLGKFETPELERQLLLALLRPQLSRALTLAGEALEDVLAVLATHCSPRQLSDAVLDTETFLDRATAEGDGPFATALMRRQLQVQLTPLAHDTSHAARIIRALSIDAPSALSCDGLRAVAGEPSYFVKSLVLPGGERPLAAQVQAALQIKFSELGLNWEDEVAPVVHQLASSGELHEGLASADAEVKLLLALLRPQLSSVLGTPAAALSKALDVLAAECSASQLGEALLDTESFLEQAVEGDSPVAKALTILLLGQGVVRPNSPGKGHVLSGGV